MRSEGETPRGEDRPAMTGELQTADVIMRGRGLAKCLAGQDRILAGRTLRQAPAAL